MVVRRTTTSISLVVRRHFWLSRAHGQPNFRTLSYTVDCLLHSTAGDPQNVCVSLWFLEILHTFYGNSPHIRNDTTQGCGFFFFLRNFLNQIFKNLNQIFLKLKSWFKSLNQLDLNPDTLVVGTWKSTLHMVCNDLLLCCINTSEVLRCLKVVTEQKVEKKSQNVDFSKKVI